MRSPDLTEGVELLSKAALLVCCVVLVKNTMSNGLVDLLHSNLVCGSGHFEVTGGERGIILLDDGAHLRLKDLVAKGLSLSNLHTLFCRFDVRHDTFLQFICCFRTALSPERGVKKHSPAYLIDFTTTFFKFQEVFKNFFIFLLTNHKKSGILVK